MLRPRPFFLRSFFVHQHPLSKCPRRFNSSPASAIPDTAAASPKPKRRFFRASTIWYILVLTGGLYTGFAVRNFAAPLRQPLPGTREDELALQALTKDIENLEIVKRMRKQGYHLHADTPLSSGAKGVHKGWIELDIKTNITESKEDWGNKTRTHVWESMAGARGLGVQRAFWNAETKELVAVVWIGTSLSGWPGIAHGGAIATIFEDCMSRMVAGPNVSIDSIDRPTSMSVTYAKPTNSTDFYVLRAHYSKPNMPQVAPPPDPEPAPAKSWLPSWKDLTKKTPPTESKNTVEIIGTLEDLDGRLCVRAKGAFPVQG